MNTEQYYLLQERKLSPDMIIALKDLVDGKKFAFQNRSYKALQRRGLASEDFQVTLNGLIFYKKYCSLEKSPRNNLSELDKKIEKQAEVEKAELAVVAEVLDEFGVAGSAVDTHDLDLRAVIKSWPNLPLEFRVLIADAAKRIAECDD